MNVQLLKVSSRWITNPTLFFFLQVDGNSRLDAKSMLVLMGFQRKTLFFPDPSKLIYSPEKSNETAASTNATMWWKRTKTAENFAVVLRSLSARGSLRRKTIVEALVKVCMRHPSSETENVDRRTIFITQPKAYVFPQNQQFSGWDAIADSTFTFKIVWVAKIHLGNILSMLLSNANVRKFFY